MHAILRLLTACIALEVWVPLIVAGKSLVIAKANGLTLEQAQAILDTHNELRTQETATDMIRMEWDPAISRSAQDHANRCENKHSSSKARKSVPGYRNVGESIFTTKGKFDPVEAVKGWHDEKKFYDRSGKFWCQPEKTCTHYTQIVWAKTRTVGCGAKYCSGKNLFVCQYGPLGNIYRQKPYAIGTKCSECPKEQSHCVKNMCYHSPKDNTKVTKVANNDGSLLRGSCLTFFLLSCATLAQIMH